MMTFPLFLFLFLHIGHTLRSRSDWNGLFASNIYQKYSSDEDYMDKLSTYHHLFSLDKQRAYLYVIRYKPNCGHICHEFIIKQYEEQFQSASYYYEIVTSDHSVIRTSLHILQTIHKLYSNIILDYIPFIPNLKYDETIFHENYCMAESSPSPSPSPSPSDGITLHIIFTILKSDPNISSFIKFGIIKDDLESFSNLIQPATKQVSCTLFLSCTLLSSTSLATILDYYSHLPIVHWIEIRPEMITYTKYANSVTQVDPPGSPHPDNIYQLYRGMNLTGQDEIIGISDTGIDITSCYFYDPDNPMLYNILNPSHRKISYYRTYIDSTDSFGHGTSVAGIAAGECYYPIDNVIEKKRKEYDSVASKSKIAFFDISGTDNVLRIPSDINENLLKVLYSAGSRIISLSWGSSSPRYTIDARNVDIFHYNNPDSLVLIAAGNSGVEGFNTVGSPATCKNGLTVGASLNTGGSWKSMSQNRAGYNKDSLASFSSRGPTFDGRRKPDVCGVGEYLYQALARYPTNDPVHADMDSVRGTSFSTPLLAAHAVLVRQYFLLGYYPSGHATLTDQCTPSGALIKALFVHSTRPLQLVIYDDSDETVGRVEQTEYGDFLQGYGRVVLSDSLQFQQVTGALDPLSLYIIGCDPGNASKSSMGYRREDMIRTLTQIGETHTYEVVLRANDNSNGRPLKVTLAYTDMYPALGSVVPLVNDLDVTVSNGTHTFYPYSPFTPSYQQIDRLNNVEVILVANPSYNSTYTITVTAHRLSTAQSYALVISGNLAFTHFIQRDDLQTKSSSIFTIFPLYVTISIFIVLISIFVICLFYIVKYHKDYVSDKTLNQHETFYSLRESNLRSFSERYDQFNEMEMPSIPQTKSKKMNRRSQRDSRVSRSSNGSILYGHDLQELYPQLTNITPAVSPYMIQPSSQAASRDRSTTRDLPHRTSKSFNSKTCSKDLLQQYSLSPNQHTGRTMGSSSRRSTSSNTQPISATSIVSTTRRNDAVQIPQTSR